MSTHQHLNLFCNHVFLILTMTELVNFGLLKVLYTISTVKLWQIVEIIRDSSRAIGKSASSDTVAIPPIFKFC